jgi:hypothetical protein
MLWSESKTGPFFSRGQPINRFSKWLWIVFYEIRRKVKGEGAVRRIYSGG